MLNQSPNPSIKFGRNYKLMVQRNTANAIFPTTNTNTQQYQFLTVEPPLTLEFDIQRFFMGFDVSKITIYNLGQESRYSITRPSYDMQNVNKIVYLYAGYGATGTLPLLYKGWMNLCSSRRDGVNYVTDILAQSWGYLSPNSHFTNTYSQRTPYNIILKDLVNQLVKDGGSVDGVNNYSVGQIVYFPSPTATSRDMTLNGNTLQLIKDMVGWNNIFIDNGKINIKQVTQNTNFDGVPSPTISSQNGIIGVPTIEGGYIYIDTILDPSLAVGQKFNLQSLELPNIFNGQYTVCGLSHKGTISGAVCGDAITTIQANAFGANIKIVPNVSIQSA